MKIESISKQIVETTYHVRLSIGEDEYLFVVSHHVIVDNPKGVLSEGMQFFKVRRGRTFWDCGKRLSNKQKKEIEEMIIKEIKSL